MAGDLMTPYATEAARPMPCSVPLAVVLFGAANHQPVNSRKVTFASDDDEDFTSEDYIAKAQERKQRAPVQKPDTLARYVAVLSKQEWTSSRDISRALHVNVNAANRYLSTYKEMFEKRQEMRRTGLSNLWKLKCAPA